MAMFRGGGRSVRVLAAAALIAVSATFLRGAVPASVSASTSALVYTSIGTWTVDPAAGRVHVDLQVSATSHAQDSDGRHHYYPGVQLTLPISTLHFVAVDQKGDPLNVAVRAVTQSGTVVFVTFRQRLLAGQSNWFDLKFDLADLGGSTDRNLRIGQDIMSFPVSGFGSEGTPGSSATVVFPSGYVVQEPFGALTSAIDKSGNTVFSSGIVPDATALNAWFTASRTVPADGFHVAYISVGTLYVTLRFWADDPGWETQVQQVLTAGYPIVRDLIGLGDPPNKSLTIEEATTQGIGGFSGEYDPNNAFARVSYFADPVVILHEVAHMWLNGELASDRWIEEGFASYYAEQAVVAMGLPDRAPILSPSLMSAAMPLNDWDGAATPGSATEAYLYGASLEVARRIANLAGTAGLQKVWAQAANRSAAYATPAKAYRDLPAVGVADWESLLDYLEATTGRSYSSIWQQWVVDPSQAALLKERGVARAQFSATSRLAGLWSMPADIREAMGEWQFASAESLLSLANGVLDSRQEIASDAHLQGATPPMNLQVAFEEDGTIAAVSEAAQETAALNTIAAAARARAQSQGAARVFGLVGTDPDADLAAARLAFSSGDVSRAHSLANAARAAWAGATGIGQLRILGTVAGLAGALLLLAVYIWTRAGRRRPELAKTPTGDPVEPADA
jgi:hypothetical protein